MAAATRDAETAAVPGARPRPPSPRVAGRRPVARAAAIPAAAAARAALARSSSAWGVVAAHGAPGGHDHDRAALASRSARSPMTIAIADRGARPAAGRSTDTATVTATGTYRHQGPGAAWLVTFLNFNFVRRRMSMPGASWRGPRGGRPGVHDRRGDHRPGGRVRPVCGRITAGEASVAVTAAASSARPATSRPRRSTPSSSQNLAAQLRGLPDQPRAAGHQPRADGRRCDRHGRRDHPGRMSTPRTPALREALMDRRRPMRSTQRPSAPLRRSGRDRPSRSSRASTTWSGPRDAETAEISGTLAYDRLTVDRRTWSRSAIERLGDGRRACRPDGELLAIGHRGGASARCAGRGWRSSSTVTVRGRVTPIIDRDAVHRCVIGLSGDDAVAAARRSRVGNRRPVARLGRHRARQRLADRGIAARSSRPVSGVIGLDHGAKRIGVAVGDTEIAHGLRPRGHPSTQPRAATWRSSRSSALRRARSSSSSACRCNMDGTEGDEAAGARLRRAVAAHGMRIAYEDERLSSWEAGQTRPSRPAAPRESGELDSTAARLILQQYLDARLARTGSSPRGDRMSRRPAPMGEYEERRNARIRQLREQREGPMRRRRRVQPLLLVMWIAGSIALLIALHHARLQRVLRAARDGLGRGEPRRHRARPRRRTSCAGTSPRSSLTTPASDEQRRDHRRHRAGSDRHSSIGSCSSSRA